MKSSASISQLVRWMLLLLWALFAAFPIYWMVVTAAKEQKDIYQGPFFVPGIDFKPSMRSWETIVGPSRDEILPAVLNSVLFATIGSFFAVVIGAFAGYGLARYVYNYGPFKNRDITFTILSQYMAPPIVAVVALFAMFSKVRLLDTYIGMIIAYTWFSLPLTVFLLTYFISRLPVDIERAAAIDGYGKVEQIRRVVLPLAMPGLAAAYLLAFFFIWSDFLLALMLTFQRTVTIPVVIANLSTEMEPAWWLISAVGLFAIIPPAIAVIFLDRFIERQTLRGGTR